MARQKAKTRNMLINGAFKNLGKLLRDDGTKLTKYSVLITSVDHIVHLTRVTGMGGPNAVKRCNEIERNSRERRIASERRKAAIAKQVFEAIIFSQCSHKYNFTIILLLKFIPYF